jgi:hypothetical protein
MSEHLNQAVIGGGLTICGLPPRERLVTIDPHPCWNCQGARVLRVFSGSGWYEDHKTCLDCGEDVASGYRPFRPRWRKDNIASAEKWLDQVIPSEDYFRMASAAVREEMQWNEEPAPTNHTNRDEGTR